MYLWWRICELREIDGGTVREDVTQWSMSRHMAREGKSALQRNYYISLPLVPKVGINEFLQAWAWLRRLLNFSDFFKEKQTKIVLKKKTIKKSKYHFLWIFCTIFLHKLAKFQDSSFIRAQVISQNVMLNKSYVCKKWHFLWKFA